jgi:hypothetical protein
MKDFSPSQSTIRTAAHQVPNPQAYGATAPLPQALCPSVPQPLRPHQTPALQAYQLADPPGPQQQAASGGLQTCLRDIDRKNWMLKE